MADQEIDDLRTYIDDLTQDIDKLKHELIEKEENESDLGENPRRQFTDKK